MGISLSTAWNASGYHNGREIIQEIKNLGFSEIELSFNLTRKIVEDILAAVQNKEIRVNSLHNYCPIPEGLERKEALPDCYSLASTNEKERAQALKYTKVTIDTASRLNARAVVLHCGRVEIPDHTRELISFYNNVEMTCPKAKRLIGNIQKERARKAPAYINAALKSLEELSSYAAELKINLGVENRFYFREIPSFTETGKILEHFKGSNVYYWHDTGHAQLWENLGLLKHKEYLDNYSQYLLGVHLHDILGAYDHKAPLTGNFDFRLLLPYLKKDTIKTLEPHYPASSAEIVFAKEYLENLYDAD